MKSFFHNYFYSRIHYNQLTETHIATYFSSHFRHLKYKVKVRKINE